MEGNYSKLQKHLEENGSELPNINGYYGKHGRTLFDPGHLQHLLSHIFGKIHLPLQDLYPLSKEQLGLFLQSLDYLTSHPESKEWIYDSTKLTNRDSNSEGNCNDISIANINEISLMLYCMYYGKNDLEIEKIVKNWKEKKHSNSKINKPLILNHDNFAVAGHDKDMEGLYNGTENYTGKESNLTDLDLIKYARNIFNNIQEYQSKKKTTEDLEAKVSEFRFQNTVQINF
jgi:uncharacterized protein YfeS